MAQRSRRLRVGVAGLGFGASVHAKALGTLPELQIEGIAGTTKEKAAVVALASGIPHSFGSVNELLELDLDAVFLALPPNTNEVAAATALDRGFAVFSEKPLAASFEAARALAARAEASTTAVDFQFAELESFTALKQLIDRNELGRVLSVDISWRSESYSQKNKVWSWKTDADQGGGVMALLGCHALYLVEWLFGPVETVRARLDDSATRAFAPSTGNPAPDRVEMELGVGDILVRGLITNSDPTRAVHRWNVVFEHGELKAENAGTDYMAGFTLQQEQPSKILAREESAESDGRIKPFGSLAKRFVDAISSSDRCRPDFGDGARVQLLMECVQKSAESSRTIPITEASLR